MPGCKNIYGHFSKKNKGKGALLFEKRSKNFFLLGIRVFWLGGWGAGGCRVGVLNLFLFDRGSEKSRNPASRMRVWRRVDAVHARRAVGRMIINPGESNSADGSALLLGQRREAGGGAGAKRAGSLYFNRGASGMSTTTFESKADIAATLSKLKQPTSAVIEKLCERAAYASDDEYQHLRALIKALRSLSSLPDRLSS
jgi:hypothetical protein